MTALNNELHEIAVAATTLADRLPPAVQISFAEAISRLGPADSPAVWASTLHVLPTAEFRDAAKDFLDHWCVRASGLSPQAAAAALFAAVQAEVMHRKGEAVEIVWTGPESSGGRFRQTEQAILEVINSATKRLTIVSYAVYRIPRIQNALIAAANRGVSIRVIVETPNLAEGQNEYNCLLALGANVASVASVYFWPHEKRPKDENGKTGILHVKCAVADGRQLFLSSANFTDYAFTINMELGLLVTGGKLPGIVERHFDELVIFGTLVCI